MRIDIQGWERLNPPLSTAQSSPPAAVYLLVHTLMTGDAEVEAGYAERTSQDTSTVWRHWLITESALIHTEVEYAAADYDQAAEDQASRGNPSTNYIEPTIRQAWVRPLDSITSLRIGYAGPLSGFKGDWYPIDGVVLTFADGSTAPLPGQASGSQSSHGRSDAFLYALRSRLNF